MAAMAQTAVGIQALSFSANCSSVQKLGDGLVQKLGDGLVRDKKMCPPSRKPFQVRAMAPKKKVNAYDDGWSKQWFGAGIFAEGQETEPVNIVKKVEKMKLLSQVEKAGLLSKAESLGVSLSLIEKLGLLSKAEDLGLLSLAERFATASPPTLASLSLPLFVLAIAIPVLVPDSSSALVVLQNVVSLLCLGAGGALFVGSIVLSGLQEE